jgi:hypothetical protein
MARVRKKVLTLSRDTNQSMKSHVNVEDKIIVRFNLSVMVQYFSLTTK